MRSHGEVERRSVEQAGKVLGLVDRMADGTWRGYAHALGMGWGPFLDAEKAMAWVRRATAEATRVWT